jgi:phosphopantothenoylcysteine decarboxylase/phosphopantothenate--cysteine ligase
MPTVVLGVTGCIAAYKAAELVRLMCGRGWRVKVVMTAHAREFITPLTLQTLSGEPVASEMFEPASEGPLPHLSLADEADCLLIAPATANFLAKVAGGVADDLLTTTALATRAPMVVAPAMNTKMWADDATRANVRRLEELGAVVVEPGEGALACGEEGAGRLAALDGILASVQFELERARSLEGRRVVVTAGGTREPLDPVRYLGNRSSGRMGYALADEAARMGAEVVLVTGPSALPRPSGVTVVEVQTALEMRDAVRGALWPEGGAGDPPDALVMAAAVADYRPAAPHAEKVKKGDEPMELALVRNPDILQEVGEARAADPAAGPKVLVGFAAETLAGDELAAAARAKLAAKKLDLVVANDVAEEGAGFETETNRVALVDSSGDAQWAGPAHKRAIARVVLSRVAALLTAGGGSDR